MQDIAAANWLFETCLDAFVVTRERKIVSVNGAWTKLTGYGLDETLGRSVASFTHPDDGPAVAAILKDMAETGCARGEHRIVAKDGRWLWVSLRARRCENGEVVGLLRDITTARSLDADVRQLARSTALLREASGLFVWRYNPETRSYIFDHDVTRGELRDSQIRSSFSVADEIHPDDVAMVDKAFRQTLRTGEYGVVEYRNRRPDATWGHLRVAWRGVRVLPSGRWEVLGLSQDVTEIVEARDLAIRGEQAAHAAAEVKSQFLANMSHEIRTPMNGVLGVLHLLKSEPLSDEGRRLLNEALACGAMLSGLLNDVIDVSKVEAGHLELSPEPTDPAAALHGVADLLRQQAEARGLYLTVEADPDLGWMSIDPVRLRQMLFNLIGNGVKFTLAGGVTVRMSAHGQGAERRLKVEVRDTGVGVAPAARERLFDRFHQADGSMTRRFGGSGLGLSITRSLAELMGGGVGYESELGQGSTFWFEIAAPAVDASAPLADDHTAWLEGLRVLV
ncbi:MAG TPA: ATP-binding protein, partial [Caulobacteraceae bacterium]|nr:ATP-binding protein [Caulobacteraceae bacterium]